jgi:hypothetical protein
MEIESEHRKLIGQRFGRCANCVATFQNAFFAEQDDVLSILMFQVAVDVASLAALKMILEHFNR